jgi:hypothetical protein
VKEEEVRVRNINVRIVHTTNPKVYTGTLECFGLEDNHAVIFFGTMIGRREFNFNHGWGVAPQKENAGKITEWKIHPADLESVRSEAKRVGKKVSPCGKGTGRKRQPRRGKEGDPRQLHFGSLK